MTKPLSELCSEARDKFGAYLLKEQSSRSAARAALSACYGFSQMCFDEQKVFAELCKASKINESGNNTNRYIPVVRLVFGRNVDGVWESINPQQTSKYANLLDYAEFLQIETSGFDAWLKNGSYEGYLSAARADESYQLARGREDRLALLAQRASSARKQIETRRKNIFGSGVSLKIDMTAVGAPTAGLRHLVVEVLESGRVQVIGFNNDDIKAVEDSMGRALKRGKWHEEHPLSDLLKVIHLSKMVKRKVNRPAYITFENQHEKCNFLISRLGIDAAPIGKITTPEIPSIPHGQSFVLTREDSQGIWKLSKWSEDFDVIASQEDMEEDRQISGAISTVLRSKYLMVFTNRTSRLQATLYAPAANAMRRVDLKRKTPEWDIEISLNKELQEAWLHQESLAPVKLSGKEIIQRYLSGRWNTPAEMEKKVGLHRENKLRFTKEEREKLSPQIVIIDFDKVGARFYGWDEIQYGELTWPSQGVGKSIRIRMARGDIATAIKPAFNMGAEIVKLKANADVVGVEVDGLTVYFPTLDSNGDYSSRGFKKVAWKIADRNQV